MGNLQENTSDPESIPSVIPPEDAQLVTEDGGVKKCVIRDGSGNPPPLHSSCLGMHRSTWDIYCFDLSQVFVSFWMGWVWVWRKETKFDCKMTNIQVILFSESCKYENV